MWSLGFTKPLKVADIQQKHRQACRFDVTLTVSLIETFSRKNWLLYLKQKYYYVHLLRKTKISYFENLGDERISKNIILWKWLKPLLSYRLVVRDTINRAAKKNCKERFKSGTNFQWFLYKYPTVLLKLLRKTQQSLRVRFSADFSFMY